jgi:hypothetical protein
MAVLAGSEIGHHIYHPMPSLKGPIGMQVAISAKMRV